MSQISLSHPSYGSSKSSSMPSELIWCVCYWMWDPENRIWIFLQGCTPSSYPPDIPPEEIVCPPNCDVPSWEVGNWPWGQPDTTVCYWDWEEPP